MKTVIVTDGKNVEPKLEWNVKSVTLLAVLMVGTLLVILLVGGRLDQNELDSWVKQSADWVATEGQITDLSTYQSSGSQIRSRYARTWSPTVKYVYMVNGAKFTGDTIGRPALIFYSKADAEQYLTNFKKLGKVTVYYDPKMISHSCLVKGKRLTADTEITRAIE